LALALAAIVPAGAGAQTRGDRQSLLPPGDSVVAPTPRGPAVPGGSLLAPGVAEPQAPLSLPSAPIAAPIAPPVATPSAPPSQAVGKRIGPAVALALSARFGPELPAINGGLHWRVYSDQPQQEGPYRLVKEDKSASPTLALPPGRYVVSVAFGLATAVKAVALRAEGVRETFVIPAGGLRLEGRVGDVKIPSNQISFDIYRGSQFEPGDKQMLAHQVLTGDVVTLPEGTYHIISNYGDGNAVVRSDIRVAASKLTDVTVTHRAAVITLKLVAAKGGEALANTAWSVLTPGGDVIKESTGAFPRVILAEGEYRAIARNEGKVYEHDFNVITGVDGEVEVLAR